MIVARQTAASVTVIIPTFNRAEFLPWSVKSILEQTLAPDQVIVVDDGSTEATRLALRPFAKRITYLAKSNGGKPSAINYALPYVNGDYLWVFDDDDVACADALERHVAVLERRPDVAFTFSGSYRCVTGGNPDLGIVEVRSENPVRPFHDDEYLIEMMLSSYVGSPGVMVRTDIQRRAGPYRLDLVRSEDYEMGIRWALLGRGARLDTPTPTFYRRYHEGLRGPRQFRFVYSRDTELSREAEREILRSLDSVLRLERYLPWSDWETPLDEKARATAVARRLAVRVRRGMWPEALEDLGWLESRRSELVDAAVVSAGHYLRAAIGDAGAAQDVLHSTRECLAVRRLLARPRLQAVRRELYKGLYWLLRRQAANGELRGAQVAAVAAWRLVGPIGLVKSFPWSQKLAT